MQRLWYRYNNLFTVDDHFKDNNKLTRLVSMIYRQLIFLWNSQTEIT